MLLSFSGLVLALFTAFTVAFRNGRRTPRAGSGRYPMVSLLKPVKGLDDGLAGNIESFYAQDYPAFEVLFAVDGFDDPAVGLLRKFQDRHPEVRTRIIAAGVPELENPKIHKLARLEARSRGELLWVSDSNVRVAPDTLRRLADEYLAGGAKAVFSPIRGASSRTFASLMENSGLNFFTSGSIIAFWSLGHKAVLVGKSILIEKAALRTFGGFDYFRSYLAEDHLLGEAFTKSGFKVSTNFVWVDNVNRTASVESFFKRMTRWAVLRFHLSPPVYLLEILLNPVALALAGIAVTGGRAWGVAAAAAAGKIGLEYINFLFVGVEDRRRLLNHLRFPAAVLAKDLMLLAVFFIPFFAGGVEWRGRRIRVGRMTLIQAPGMSEEPVYEGA